MVALERFIRKQISLIGTFSSLNAKARAFFSYDMYFPTMGKRYR